MQAVIESLRLRLPAKETLLGISAAGELDGVHETTIFPESELAPIGQAIPGSAVPSTVDLLWLAMSGELQGPAQGYLGALWLTLHCVNNFCNLSISALVRFGLSCNSMNLV